VAFAPDGRTIATGEADGTVRIWDVASGRELATFRGGQLGGGPVAFSPDGRALASGNLVDGAVRIWDLASGREAATLRGHKGVAMSLAFSPDGRTIATGGRDDGTVRIWDVASGRELATLRGGQRGFGSVAFSPDGRTLASGSMEGPLKIWDATPITPERRAHLEAVSLVSFLVERAISSADLRDRIRRDPTVSDEVRARAQELANGHWDARVRREADALVQPLFAEGYLRDEVSRAVRERTGLLADIRARAIEVAQTWPEFPLSLNIVSRIVARDPGRNPTAYLQAMRRAEAACRYEPDNGGYLNTLGMAQYRAGRYHDAVTTLERSIAINGGHHPVDLACLAMAQQRLGQTQAARRTLAQLRTVIYAPGTKNLGSPGEYIVSVTMPNDPTILPSMPWENAPFLLEAEAVIELDPAFPDDPFAP
jgi:hypothetical protein